ncbi:MAG: polyphosphate kinase 1 [Bacteroidota bacterium]|nr:polyphosphate kinase 1 [Bacteroidota bacterium]MDX5429773.1 polyphosphate kinase 1 [Bacteroidota bacterium]MDX5468552.1 polyphosphate kinase 1 [Bacteroidota bacterium]
MSKHVDFVRINREISWLSFNERVLQEAENPSVPLAERMKFLAIFSSNLDEFFRVRVASVRRLLKYQKKQKLKGARETAHLLNTIQKRVVDQQDRFTSIFEEQIIPGLAERKIFIVNEHQLSHTQRIKVKEYYKAEVLSYLFPVMLDHLREFPFLRDKSIYLAVKMAKEDGSLKPKYALVEVPSEVLNRFFILPSQDDNTYIMMLDDVIRISLPDIFSFFDYDHFEAYTIKLTRDAELDIDLDLPGSMVSKIEKSLKERPKGAPVRFIYDEEMPEDMLRFIIKRAGISKESIIPGGRYHNFKDFFDFPKVGGDDFWYETIKPLTIPRFENTRVLFDEIKKKDVLLHHPYQSFDYVIRFLREAAIDPSVYAIKITLYRVAKHSNIVNSLINAVKNGKEVTVVMELQARFDEESNLYWTNKLQEAGANVIFGVPDFKIHAKCCVIFRRENNKTVHYAHLSTGNYNGRTARLYSDTALFTADPRITKDVIKVFSFIKNFPKIQYKFSHLLVAPYYMKMEYLKLIDAEIRQANKGKPAFIYAKMNSLVDEQMIDKLYEASNAGVKIRLIVRGICCLVPGVKGQSENIEAISIVDKFLEHSRFFIFHHSGTDKLYLSSADWMSRNLDKRIETAYPVYDPDLKKELMDLFMIQWNDNVKARIIGKEQLNTMKPHGLPSIRSQFETYDYLRLK